MDRAEQILFTKYNKLHKDLAELVAALNALEPGGTLVDDIVFHASEGGKVRVAYVATPIQVTITTPERKFILKVIENGDEGKPIKLARSRIEKHRKELFQ